MEYEHTPMTLGEDAARALAQGINEIIRETGDGILPGTYAAQIAYKTDGWEEGISEDEIMRMAPDEDHLAQIIAEIDVGSQQGYEALRSTLHQAVDPTVQTMMMRPYTAMVEQESKEDIPSIEQAMEDGLSRLREGYDDLRSSRGYIHKAAEGIARSAKWEEHMELYQADINQVMNTVVSPKVDELLGSTLAHYHQ